MLHVYLQKGSFVFRNFNHSVKRQKIRRNRAPTLTSLLVQETKETWHKTYSDVWKKIESEIEVSRIVLF